MNNQFKVSLMCMDFTDLKNQIEILDRKMDGYHVDIMDGHFCKNITLSPDFTAAVARLAKKPIDVHLMTTDPNDWIDLCADAGAQTISVHAETINTDAFRTFNRIEARGCKIGVTLNPATPLEYCREYLNRVDLLTIMTVDVGFAGQPFIENMLEKIREAKELRESKGYHYRIMIDGSCNKKTFRRLYEAGADDFVLGNSGLFSLDPDLEKACDMCRETFIKETTE
ncbi:MAG: D-allulose 6-phosphate 3-epimerase [Eubacteriales bacterium]|jgi:D-allulose-6-phosphate 3-epimerase